MWKAVVFDLDGVLLDTEPLQYEAWVNVLKRFGVMKFSKEEYIKCTGRSVKEIAAEMADKYGFGNPEKFAHERFAEIERLLKEGELKLMPFAMEAIAFFKKAGFSIAIASGSRRDELEIKMKRSGLDKIIKDTASESDVPAGRGKPHPDIYIKAVSLLKVRPSECISFEDTPPGVQAVKSAGLDCFAVPNKYVKGRDFHRADRVFGSLEGAVNYIKHEI